MKISLIVLSLLFISMSSFSQDRQSKKSKFEFQKVTNGKTKKIKMGKPIKVVMKSQDTTTVYLGTLESLNNDSLVLLVNLKSRNISKDGNRFNQEEYLNGARISIHKAEIEKIGYGRLFNLVSSSVLGVSVVNMLFCAPLLAIDKNSEDGFNVPQYREHMKLSSILTLLSLPGELTSQYGYAVIPE